MYEGAWQHSPCVFAAIQFTVAQIVPRNFAEASFRPFAGVFYAAARSSLSAPRKTIFSTSSGNGLCSAFASSQGARRYIASSSVVGITGIAFGWIGATIALGTVVRKP